MAEDEKLLLLAKIYARLHRPPTIFAVGLVSRRRGCWDR
jgi:hypothetical protein